MKQTSRFSLIAMAVLTPCLFFLLSTNGMAHQKNYKGEFVSPPCVPNVLKDGIYIGAGVGYDAYRVRQSIFELATPSLNVGGFLGGLYAGYGRYFDWFYIAGEILAQYTGAESGFSKGAYHSNFNVRETYGAAILPGVSIKKVALLYARFGVVRSFFSATENLPSVFDLKTTSWGNGLQYGLGVEGLIYKNVSLRGEYAYTSYTSFKSPINTSYTTSNNQFVLSVLYHFDYL